VPSGCAPRNKNTIMPNYIPIPNGNPNGNSFNSH